MPIEVKQLVVKGEVHRGGDSNTSRSDVDVDSLRQELLEACRRMVEEMLERQRER